MSGRQETNHPPKGGEGEGSGSLPILLYQPPEGKYRRVEIVAVITDTHGSQVPILLAGKRAARAPVREEEVGVHCCQPKHCQAGGRQTDRTLCSALPCSAMRTSSRRPGRKRGSGVVS